MGIQLSEMADPVDRVTSLLKLSTLSGGAKDHAGIIDLFRELNRALEEQPKDATVNITSGKRATRALSSHAKLLIQRTP